MHSTRYVRLSFTQENRRFVCMHVAIAIFPVTFNEQLMSGSKLIFFGQKSFGIFFPKLNFGGLIN
jgi:hypothetical protein